MASSAFDLASLVQGVMGSARIKVASEGSPPPPKKEEAKSEDKDKKEKKEETTEEAKKLASAVEYVVSAMEQGNVDLGPVTDLERVKEAYDIVNAVENDPRLKFRIKQAMEMAPPKEPATGPGIFPGMTAPNALANDLNDRPGGGGNQPRNKAQAPASVQPPKEPADAAPSETASNQPTPGAIKNDINDRPGGENYPEGGIIRKTATKRVTAMGRLMRKMSSSPPAPPVGSKAAPMGAPAGTSEVGEAVPKVDHPAEVASNTAAIDFSKRDAKVTGGSNVKSDLDKVLDTPPFTNDDIISQNLTDPGNVSKLASLARQELARRVVAGELPASAIKTAASNGLLKVAEEEEKKDEKSDGKSESGSDSKSKEQAFKQQLQDAARKKGEEKKAPSASSDMPDSGEDSKPSIPGY